MKIKDIVANNQFDIKGLVSKVEERETKTGSPYVTMLVVDKTGSINLKLWSTSLSDIKNGDNLAGKVIRVSGLATGYYGELQASVTVSDIQMTIDNSSEYIAGVPNDFDKADETIHKTLNYLFEHASGYHQIVLSVLFNEKPNEISSRSHENVSFDTQPAAERIHHAFKGGLKYHTARMLEQAIHLTKVYPVLNAPLLYTAILLHDAGKMLEYTATEPTETTVDGALLGHIMIVDGWIVEFVTKNNYDVNADEWRLLRHTVLAHHGRLEWGSPVLAITPEAMIINEIDMTDAKIMQFETAYEQTPNGELSHDKFFGLNNKRVYHS